MSPRVEALARAFAEPVTGPIHRPAVRALAVALVGGLLAWSARAVLAAGPATLEPVHWAAGAVLVVALLWPMPTMLLGRTVVDARGIRQLGWQGREVAWAEMQRVRFVRVPMAPRLMVSTGFGRVRVFHSGSAELDAAFERAARLLTGPIEEPA